MIAPAVLCGYSNLYIHVPFCAGKCAYCAFYSEASATEEDRALWLDAIERALRIHSPCLQGLHSIYMGGGTPTLLSERMLEKLFAILRKYTHIESGGEISIESNPESVTRSKAELTASFANRVTLGVQSFNARHLSSIGRTSCDVSKIYDAFALYAASGVGNLGLDLIYAIPGQTREDFFSDIDIALSLDVKHISCYSLTFEENARLAPSADYDSSMYDGMWYDCASRLDAAFFHRYEISNYARRGFESRHNMNIWHGETYLGLGPSAASFDGVNRFTAAFPLREWLNGAPPEVDEIPRDRRLREMFIFGLRTVRGWSDGEFERVSGGVSPEDVFAGEILSLRSGGLMNQGALSLTLRGLALWDNVAESFL